MNEVIGRTGKGYTTRIGFDLDDPMGESTCVSCGECVAACPTGALTNKTITLPLDREERDDGGRFGLPVLRRRLRDHLLHAATNKIVWAEGRDSPGNDGRLCVKGRYGWDYAMHEQRLTKPLIRREEFYPKGPLSPEVADSQGGKNRRSSITPQVMPAFREATWDEALDLIAVALARHQGETWPAGAGRVRLGQVQQRGGLPLPEADAGRAGHQQRRPLHPTLPRLAVSPRCSRGSAPERSPMSSATPSTPT